MPSLSQYGDAESYQIGEPEETTEWYEHDETGNQTQDPFLPAPVFLKEPRGLSLKETLAEVTSY